VPLNQAQAIEAADYVYGLQATEMQDLDVLRRYVTGKQTLPLVIPRDAPPEVREMARISRINLISIVVNAMVESLYVDNMRVPESDDRDAEQDKALASQLWAAWQANKLDRGQSGLYRACFTYGYAYQVVTKGDPYPVVRPLSPRRMTAVYGNDPDWPRMALERRRDGFRLYDGSHVYILGRDAEKKSWSLLDEAEHGSPYCPVIRYVDAEDLDVDDEPEPGTLPGHSGNTTRMVAGQVAPLMTLQDQADVTSFGLQSAQWYSAFRQRWIVGWTPESKAAKVAAAASQMWTFDNDPDEVKLGEFAETTLDGYLRSRQDTLRYAATLSQTPVHELIGELVNLSAEALAAAEAGRDRKIDERKSGLGESHEQTQTAVGYLMGLDVPDDLEVVWRDTSARAFGAMVDGLGKLAQMLQVPPQMLWERIPGATRQEIERWKAEAAKGDALGNLTTLLDSQARATAPAGENTTPSGLVLPPGVQA
jgi:hypothetical protein